MRRGFKYGRTYGDGLGAAFTSYVEAWGAGDAEFGTDGRGDAYSELQELGGCLDVRRQYEDVEDDYGDDYYNEIAFAYEQAYE